MVVFDFAIVKDKVIECHVGLIFEEEEKRMGLNETQTDICLCVNARIRRCQLWPKAFVKWNLLAFFTHVSCCQIIV